MQIFEKRQNEKFLQTMGVAAAAQGSEDVSDVMEQLIDTLFPYREEERQEQVQQAMELFEGEVGREIEIKEADY